MNVAVVCEGDLQHGGSYQQQFAQIMELATLPGHNFIYYVFTQKNADSLAAQGMKAFLIPDGTRQKVQRKLYNLEFFQSIINKFKIKSLFDKELDKANIDLVVFLSPSRLALELNSHSYIATIWDLCHRDLPEFPEVSSFREFEIRDDLYSRSLKKAVAVMVDSELGKANVVKRYGVDENRVYPAPFRPATHLNNRESVDIKGKYGISGDYIFYPAQFWPHKNHVYIIDALSMLKNEGINLTAVFSGSNQGNYDYLRRYSSSKKVDDNVKFIGFASDSEMFSLYKSALAMVMPTYFGPTNMPPIEAFLTGTPVVYSDLEGLRDQVGDAALLCNLNEPESLARHLKNLLTSETLRETLIQKGTRRLEELNKTSWLQIIEKILNDYSCKRKCWE